MSFGNFSAQSMISISSAWVNLDKDRSLFDSYPLLKAILPAVEEAHTDLVKIQVKNSETTDTLKQLTQEALSVDQLHDKMLMGIHMTLTAFAEIADDAESEGRLIALRDQLFPKGPGGTGQGYAIEVGNSALNEGQLSEEMVAQLQSLPVPGGTLADVVSAWFETRRKLGEVERRRAQLTTKETMTSISLGDVSKARARWIRVAQTVLLLTELMPDLSEEDQNRILHPLRETAKNVERQQRKAQAEHRSSAVDIDAVLREEERIAAKTEKKAVAVSKSASR